MLIAAIRSKLKEVGPVAFARDAAEAAIAYTVIAGWASLLAATAIGTLVVAPAFVAFGAACPRTGARPHRCDADCAAGRTECEGGGA